MQKKTIRAGIVGTGFSATFHYEAMCKVHGELDPEMKATIKAGLKELKLDIENP
jgi:hypothetical protein